MRGEDQEMLGLDGLLALLEPIAGLPARTLVGRTEEAIVEWAEGPIRDDLCVIALRPAPG